MTRDQKDDYSAEETERRFVAALRGARIVGHKDRAEMKVGKPKGPSMTPKGVPAQSKKTKSHRAKT